MAHRPFGAEGVVMPDRAGDVVLLVFLRADSRGGEAPAEEQRNDGDDGENRQGGAEPVDPGFARSRRRSHRRSARCDAGVFERGVEVGVGDERHAAGRARSAPSMRDRRARRGCPAMPVRNEVVSAADQDRPGERGADRDAEVRHGVLQPADLARSARRGRAETVTAPSCDASMPIPRPASSIGQVTISAPAPASSAATNTTRPTNRARNPSWHDPSRRRSREHLGDPDRGDQRA